MLLPAPPPPVLTEQLWDPVEPRCGGTWCKGHLLQKASPGLRQGGLFSLSLSDSSSCLPYATCLFPSTHCGLLEGSQTHHAHSQLSTFAAAVPYSWVLCIFPLPGKGAPSPPSSLFSDVTFSGGHFGYGSKIYSPILLAYFGSPFDFFIISHPQAQCKLQ